jgi:hypothetical protein
MSKGFDMRCAAVKTARVWLQGKGGGQKPRQAFVVLPAKVGEGENAVAGYLSPMRQALIERNAGHVQVFVCESDYRALKGARAGEVEGTHGRRQGSGAGGWRQRRRSHGSAQEEHRGIGAGEKDHPRREEEV